MRTSTVLVLAFLLAGVIAASASAQVTDPVPAGPTIQLQLVAEGLNHPLLLVEPPDGSNRLFIVDQDGKIWILNPDGILLTEPFLDIEERMVELRPGYDERGLLGLAFHPDYANNGRFFVYYSAPLRPEAPADFNHTSHLSEFNVSADPDRADPASERILLQVDQPQSNHNAGMLAFSPIDGYLYVSLGDGGRANDTGVGHVEDWYDFNEGGNGQDIEQNLLGSILRIDVDGGDPYGIPPDNPFGDEQYAYGFRNPYRFSFDMGGSHILLASDAGQALFEEVSLVTIGGNYGWNVREGAHCFDAANPRTPPANCPDVVGAGHPREGDPLIDPVIDFLNSNQEGGLGLVVVGGYVYRGTQLPLLDGHYLFGVWSSGEEEVPGGDGETREINLPGRLFVADIAQAGLWAFEELQVGNDPDGALQHFLLGFGQDLEGEVYVLTTDEVGPVGNTGKVYRVAPVMPGQETYAAHLAGYNELASAPPILEDVDVPFTVQTPASGSVIATLENSTLHVVGSFSGLSADYTASHIHEAPAGVNGPVVVPLSPTLDADQRGGTFDQTVSVSPELIAALQAGRLYVNVHTTAHPPGEIRGQLLLSPNSPPMEVFTVEMAEGFSFDFTNEGDPSGTAFQMVWDPVDDPDGDRVIYQVEFALDENFDNVAAGLLTVEDGNVLTGFGATAGDVDAALEAAGVPVGAQVTAYARVNSSDGSLRSLGDALTFNVTRGVVQVEDTTPPECVIRRIDPGPPTTLVVHVQDTGSGLRAIQVLTARNTTVNVPGFTVGTTEAQTVIAEKQDENARATVVLRVTDVAGHVTECDPVIATLSAELPESFVLEQNYPNPFNPTTTIRFGVPEETHVELAVYDVMGRRVALLVDEVMQPGVYAADWNGRNDAGRPVAGGVYFYRMEAGSYEALKTMMLVK